MKRIQRPVGLLVLLFVISGLVISGFNSSREMEELIGFDLDVASATLTDPKDSSPYMVSPSGGQDEPLTSEGDDDDCLCWCGQVLAAGYVDVVTPSLTVALTKPDEARIPTAPPRLLFHPPRRA